MKIEIGFRDTVYGTVSESANSLVYHGDNVEAIQRLLQSMRGDGQSDQDLLQSLLTRLRGQVWAKTITTQDEALS